MATYVCPPRALPGAPASAPSVCRLAQRALEDVARRVQKPAALRRLARLAPDERPLVAVCDFNDAAVVATNAALHCLGPPEGSGDWSRWGWEQVAGLEWDDSMSTMTLIGQAPVLPGRVVLRLPSPGPLVDVARERVAWTTQLATRIRLPSGGTVRVVVRRQPVTDRWTGSSTRTGASPATVPASAQSWTMSSQLCAPTQDCEPVTVAQLGPPSRAVVVRAGARMCPVRPPTIGGYCERAYRATGAKGAP